MKNIYVQYKQGIPPKNKTLRAWPLYGAGFENLGLNKQMIEIPIPAYGPDELLIRHDACGLCFSDIKVIKLGQNHPRIYRNMKEKPVVLGHEVALTVVGVGENLKKHYKVGDRFILQADIFVEGINYAYGYEFQGGLSEYNIIDQRILQGREGDYLIPIQPETGYAESALVEPWACVIAAYFLEYRTLVKKGGTALFIGPEPERKITLSQGFNETSHPKKIILINMDGQFKKWLKRQASEIDIEVIDLEEIDSLDGVIDKECIDDIILFDPSSKLVEKVSPFLSYQGILVIATEKKLEQPIQQDVGRVHYNRWLFIGGNESDISQIYLRNPIKSSLKKGGTSYFVGAGGPMGRMHIQHAIESEDKPGIIVCSDISEERLDDLTETFCDKARQKGIEWVCLNPSDETLFHKKMSRFAECGFDNIIILAPIPKVISDCSKLLADNGVMNIFAGISRGNYSSIDLNDVIFRNIRIIGHSASSVDDMKNMLHEVESGNLSTNMSVAAIGSLEAVPDGLRAVQDTRFSGKIVIFPNIKPLPLTAVSDLQKFLPSVYEKLEKGRIWTKDAEIELLEKMAIVEENDN
jgi:D-arabinose 1-dehydrogenase-like Zn-dependent alcohol dehydrogenase